MQSAKTIVVIPTYNEKENIKKLAEQIFNQSIANLKIIIIDDNSPDGTAEIVKKLSLKYPIQLIKRRKKLGIGSAYIRGFKQALAARADIVCEMDADLSHNPKELTKFIGAIHQGFDIIIGSRKISGGKIIGWGALRKFMSSGAIWISRLLLGLKTKDVTSGYRCYRRQVLEKINLNKIKSDGYAFQEEMLWLCEKNNFKIKELPITFIDRQKGKSKLSLREIINFFLTLLKLKLISGQK